MNILSIVPSPGLLVMVLVLIGGGASGLMASGLVSLSDLQDPKYKIYCVGGTIDVDTLQAPEIESDRGVKVCLVNNEEFNSLADAREAAKRFGGVGAPCSCPE